MAALSLDWAKWVNEKVADVSEVESLKRAYAVVTKEIRMNMSFSKSLKSQEIRYESLLRRFQTYAFGLRDLEETPSQGRRTSIKVKDDALLKLKRNVALLSEMSERLEYMMSEVSSASPRR